MTDRRYALHKRQAVGPHYRGNLFPRKGGSAMVTYSELFQYTLVIIGIIGLFIAVNKKK